MISCSAWYTVCTPIRTTSSQHRWSSPKSATDKASYQSWLGLQAYHPTNRENTNPIFRAAVLAYNVWTLRTIRCGVQTFHHYDMIPTDGMGSSDAHRISPEFHRLLQGKQCWSQHEDHSEYRWLRNLVRFLGFAESPTKISGKSSKVQNKKTEIVKSISLPLPHAVALAIEVIFTCHGPQKVQICITHDKIRLRICISNDVLPCSHSRGSCRSEI